jgi:DNA polymerase
MKDLYVSFQKRPQFSYFEKVWENCQRCPLHSHRSRVVHIRGRIPASILFVGEAPGRGENASGFPFKGESGRRVFDPLLAALEKDLGHRLDFAVINTVGCMPEADDPTTGDLTLRPPTKQEVYACAPRFQTLVNFVNPWMIVLMGKSAEKLIPPYLPDHIPPERIVPIMHPAGILRVGGVNSVPFKRSVLTILKAMRSS